MSPLLVKNNLWIMCGNAFLTGLCRNWNGVRGYRSLGAAPIALSPDTAEPIAFDHAAPPRTAGAAVGVTAYEVSTAVVDIKPGSSPNAIHPGLHGAVPVAILSNPDFDETTAAPDTVELAESDTAVR